MMMVDRIIFSRRKTMQLEITRTAEVVVRAPIGTSPKKIEAFLAEQEQWIRVHRARRQAWLAEHPEPTEAEKQKLIEQAREYLPARTMEYAKMMKVMPSGIRITSARTRFGSCSAKNAICYSWRLMQYPLEAVDAVIVHELAHILHKNHGKEFYRTIVRFMPDYFERHQLLKG